MKPSAKAAVVWVTGPSGAGRSTAINALEDLGFEVIDNLPLSLLPRLLDGPPPGRLALGIDVRNRDFSTDWILEHLGKFTEDPEHDVELLYLDCRPDVLIRRYSETRRRHPLAPAESPEVGIAREIAVLEPVRGRADVLLDTTDLTPHDLRAEIQRQYGGADSNKLSVSVHSFSYKRGLPRGVDMVFDVRFLRNPHWESDLRALDGRDPAVQTYVAADDRFTDVFGRIRDLVLALLPGFKAEGKTSLAIAFGCTGGQHRSVAVAEKLANALAEHGWQVSTRHRELERRGLVAPSGTLGTRT